MNNQKIMRYRRAIGEIEALYHEVATKHGLSNSAYSILYAICSQGDRCSLKDIVLYSCISKQTVNSALRKLEEEGILYLQMVNGKNKEAVLTEKGKELADKTAKKLLLLEEKLLNEIWSEDEFNKYTELSEKFGKDLKGLIEREL